MIILKVIEFDLQDDVKDFMPVSVYKDVKDWLKNWSIENNIKMLVADNFEDGIERYTEQLNEDFRKMHIFHEKRFKHFELKTEYFYFKVSKMEVDDRRFFWESGYAHHNKFKLGE